jgi:uncharacterized protein DUF3309
MLGLSNESARIADAGIVPARQENKMSLGMILLIVVVLMLLGAIPTWPHSRSWGYGPSSGLGLVLMIIVVLLVLGRL